MARKPSPEKRASIVAAATQVFVDEGYETTSMDRIAACAGASKRTVYNYFPSKEALFLAVIERLAAKMHAAKRVEWDPDRPLEDQLAAMARTKSAVADDPSELALARVVLSVFVAHPKLAEAASFNHADDPLVPWLEAAVAAGRLVVPDVALAARMFWALAAGALFWPTLLNRPMPDNNRDVVVSEIVQIFLARYRG